MPLYEYLCPECERVEELVRPMSERDIVPDCLSCGAKTRKITSKMTFRLDGSGWSSDGYSTLKDKAGLV